MSESTQTPAMTREELIPPEHLVIEAVSLRPHGGQHVGPHPSAVKVTHLPTETVVIVGSGRSQYHNRAAALRMIEFHLTDPEARQPAGG